MIRVHGTINTYHGKEKEHMKRNVEKTIKQGKRIIETRNNLDMNTSELIFFFNNFNKTANETGVYNALWDAVVGAYKMGLAVGMRNARK